MAVVMGVVALLVSVLGTDVDGGAESISLSAFLLLIVACSSLSSLMYLASCHFISLILLASVILPVNFFLGIVDLNDDLFGYVFVGVSCYVDPIFQLDFFHIHI